MSGFFEYAERNGFAIFPVPPNSKAAAFDFTREHSRDRDQWQRWRDAGHNLGIYAAGSRLITVDIDAKGDRDSAWVEWCRLCREWGIDPVKHPPHVDTPSGGWHVFFQIPDGTAASALTQRDLVQRRINTRVEGYTIAPGSTIDGAVYSLHSDAPPYTAPQGLIEALERRTAERPAGLPGKGERDVDDVRKLIEWLNERGEFDDYDSWCNLGMALRAEMGDEDGFELWEIATWPEAAEAAIKKWSSFDTELKPESVGLGTFMKRAHEKGWVGNIRKSSEAMFGDVAARIEPPAQQTQAAKDVIQSSGEFVKGFVPPNYLVDGILQTGYLYSLTAQTGVGKTALAIRLAAHVATGTPIGGLAVERGTALYCAGENPIDVQARWLGLTKSMALDPATTDVHFVPGARPLSQIAAAIAAEVVRKGISPSLVVVDTAAAYFEGDDENSNTQLGAYARQLRTLVNLPGSPCVLVLCHPTKKASADEMIPRGGSAFLAEVDGNIGAVRDGLIIRAGVVGKFRGSDAWSLRFELDVIRDHPLLRDTKGRFISTVIARPISEAVAEAAEAHRATDWERVLRVLPGQNAPGMRVTDIARRLVWFVKGDQKQPATSKVDRALKSLQGEKLATAINKKWRLTAKGERELNITDSAAAVSPSVGIPMPPPPYNYPLTPH